MNKKIVMSVFFLFSVFCLFSFKALAATTGIKVIVRGETLTMDSPPLVEAGRTLVPLRDIFESLDAYVEWDGKTKTVSAFKNDTTMKLKIGDYNAYLNDSEIALDVPAKIVNGRTLVPLRFIGESLGAKVDWDSGTKTVTVSYDSSQEKKYNTTGNITNGGYVASKDNYTYVSLYKEGTWKIKDGSSEKEKLSSTSYNYINIVGDWIYFSNSIFYPVESEQQRLYKVKLDGKSLTKLSQNKAEYINIVGDWIYYINPDDDNTPYKVRLDGKGEKKISRTSMSHMIVDDGWIYFQDEDDNSLCKMRTNGKDTIVLCEDATGYLNINKVGNRIFYVNRGEKPGIYSMSEDGTDIKLIIGGFFSNINYDNGLIYYNDIKNNLYKVKEDGSNKEKIASGIKGSLLLASGWLYYTEYADDDSGDESTVKEYRIKTDGTVKQRINKADPFEDIVVSSDSSTPSPMPIVIPSPSPITTSLTTKEIARNKDAVGFIETYDEENDKLASGSGFNIDSTGTVVTNFHVIKGASSVKCTFGNTTYVVDYVLNYNVIKDVAILKLKNASNLPVVSLGDSDKIELGEDVVAIGNPLELQNTVSTGIVSGLRTTLGISYIQTTASISSGSSGGPLFNSHGEVIGITSMTFMNSQNINFAIPINTVKKLFPAASRITLSSIDNIEESLEELEPNDSRDTALEFSFGQYLSGSLDKKDDIDYYTFSINTGGKVSLFCAFDDISDTKNVASDIIMTLYDQNGNELSKSSPSNELEYTVQKISAQLEPGTYYISVAKIKSGDTSSEAEDYSIVPIFD